MFLNLGFFSDLYRRRSSLYSDTVRGYVDSDNEFGEYLKDISFLGSKSCFDKSYGDIFLNKDDEVSAVVIGTTEMLFKIRLAKHLNVDIFGGLFIQRAVDVLSDAICASSLYFLDRRLSSEIGHYSLEKINFFLDEGFSIFGEDEMAKAIFLHQLVYFYKYRDFKVFGRDWVNEYLFVEEVEMLVSRAWEVLFDFCKGQSIDFFPEIGHPDDIMAREDLLVGRKLISFCGFIDGDNFRRKCAIMKACQLLFDEDGVSRIDGCYVYEARRGRLWKLT